MVLPSDEEMLERNAKRLEAEAKAARARVDALIQHHEGYKAKVLGHAMWDGIEGPWREGWTAAKNDLAALKATRFEEVCAEREAAILRLEGYRARMQGRLGGPPSFPIGTAGAEGWNLATADIETSKLDVPRAGSLSIELTPAQAANVLRVVLHLLRSECAHVALPNDLTATFLEAVTKGITMCAAYVPSTKPAQTPPMRLEPGIYRLHWKTGGSSLAAVGPTNTDAMWYAPTNWISPNGPWDWSRVERAECVTGALEAALNQHPAVLAYTNLTRAMEAVSPSDLVSSHVKGDVLRALEEARTREVFRLLADHDRKGDKR